jgi:putative tryptophan/tyrosine transport system substrate-binding protein
VTFLNHRIGRRALLQMMVSGLVAAPPAVSAQPGTKVYRIGLVLSMVPATFAGQGPFFDRMRELGWVYERDFVAEYRVYGGRSDLIPDLAAQLVQAGVDVFIVQGGLEAFRVQQVTRTIPIVTLNAGDLVVTGLAESLAKPGGNVTGVQTLTTELIPMHLLLMKEAIPRVFQLGVLSHGSSTSLLRDAVAAAKTLNIALQVVTVERASQLAPAFSTFHARRVQGVVILRDAFTSSNTQMVAELALQYRLPTISDIPNLAAQGGLITYGYTVVADVDRLAADIVDKILRGAKAGEIPIQRATTFRLIINLVTANAMRLTLPPSLTSRADELIR